MERPGIQINKSSLSFQDRINQQIKIVSKPKMLKVTSVKPSKNNIRPNNSLKRKKQNRQSSSDKISKDPCNTPQPYEDFTG